MHKFFLGAQFRTSLRSFLVSHNFAVYKGAKGQMCELTNEGKAFMQEYIKQNDETKTVVQTTDQLQEAVGLIVKEITMSTLKMGGGKYRTREALTKLVVEDIQGNAQVCTSDLTAQQVREHCKTVLMALATTEGMNLTEAWPTEFPPESQTPDQTPLTPPDQNP